MGTNYYLRPRGFERLKQLNEETNSKLAVIRESYIKEIQDMIEESSKISPLYEDLLDRPDPSNINLYLQYEYDLPELHVCKTSGGWVPLFEATKYYKSFKELESFYSKYKDVFTLYDEYNELVDFKDLKEKVFSMRDIATETHLKPDPYWGYTPDISYWKDEDGIEWTNSRNWS